MKYFSKQEIESALPYEKLIEALKEGFREGGHVPTRHAHNVQTESGVENSLLLMPSWQIGGMIGLKMVMVCPENSLKDLETVQSTYILSDATTGEVKAILDGDELTARRTACASALASSYLSHTNSTSMLMMGAGKIAAHLIKAHTAVRELKKVYIWARRYEQSEKLALQLSHELSIEVSAVKDPEKYANICDIISCATLSNDPILRGKWLNGELRQHIDLVGGYNYDMREADNDVIATSDVYVDTFDGALAEAGDILRPIDENIITASDIRGDLFNIVDEKFSRPSSSKNTVFKSVGTALEDLIAAKYVIDNKIT